LVERIKGIALEGVGCVGVLVIHKNIYFYELSWIDLLDKKGEYTNMIWRRRCSLLICSPVLVFFAGVVLIEFVGFDFEFGVVLFGFVVVLFGFVVVLFGFVVVLFGFVGFDFEFGVVLFGFVALGLPLLILE
jgi:hypothetical protein